MYKYIIIITTVGSDVVYVMSTCIYTDISLTVTYFTVLY